MLLAYIDEIGSTGAFIHPNHNRFSDSPAFGYGGFIIPEESAREFGSYFNERPQNFRLLGSLISKLRKLDGHLFYYAEENLLALRDREETAGVA